MKNTTAYMTLSFLAVLLASCSVKKDAFNEVMTTSSQDSVVYIYRPHSMSNIMVSPKIVIDGQQKFKVENNRYLYVILTNKGYFKDGPVKHVFEMDVAERYSGIHRLSLAITQGEKIFLRVSTLLTFEKNQPYRRSFSLEKVDRETALNEIRETHYAAKQNAKKSNNTTHVKLNSGESELNNIPEDQFSISRTRNPFDK